MAFYTFAEIKESAYVLGVPYSLLDYVLTTFCGVIY